MKSLRAIFFIVVIANILTVILYRYAASMPGGSGASLAFSILWIPVIWILTFVSTAIFCIIGRKTIFKKEILKKTIPLILLSTPFPLVILFYIVNPPTEIYMAMQSFNRSKGHAIKEEEWVYRVNGKVAVKRFFELNSENYTAADDSEFRRDSVWTYFDKSGNIIKWEFYKAGKLLRTMDGKVKKNR